jgi:4'-phosphopantetheinyl transferase
MPNNLHWPAVTRPPRLAPDEVHVWAVSLDVSQRTYDALLATLSLDERARAAAYRFDEPRQRYVVARGALRHLLGHYLGGSAAAIELTVDQNQKPRLAGKHGSADLNFNVSHSGELALIAFAFDGEVGVDVEKLREVSYLEPIARKFFHSAEADEVLSVPRDTRNTSFLRCWTGKEAVLKALGKGIVADLTSFRVPPKTNVRGWVEYSEKPSRRSRCWLEQLCPCDDYVAAVASVERKCTIRTFTFDI